MSFEVIRQFEEKIAAFFGSPFAVSVDSCTHGIELCLRYTNAKEINVPKRTYLSIPFLSDKLNIKRNWNDEEWLDYYYLTDDIVDAAVLWKPNSYINGIFMCISFQYQKHLSLGRGGIILTDNINWYYGLTLSVGYSIGGWWGAKLSVKKGEKFIKLVLMEVVVFCICNKI